MAGFNPSGTVFDEGVGSSPGPSSAYPYANWSGGSGQNWGGIADLINSHIASSYVITGPTNYDPATAAVNPSSSAHYYSGYWAGIQAAMYTPQPIPSSSVPFPIPGYGEGEPFPIPMAHPFYPKEISKASNGNQHGPFDDIIPTPPPDWFTGLFGMSPAESMIFGPPTPGAPSHFDPINGRTAPSRFHPIKGRAYDVSDFIIPDIPTEQQIQDAGNPALWLSPNEVGPMDPSISKPALGLGDMTNETTPGTMIPFDITPGNNFPGDVTPGTVPR